MKKTLLTLILTFSMIAVCNAQKIETKKVFGGYQYTLNGKKMSMRDLVEVMNSNSEALRYIQKAKSNNIMASILGGAGGALIGFPIGTAIGGGDPNWTLAGIGAGLIAIGIPVSSSANKNTQKAIDLYNSSSSTSFHPEFKIIGNGDGIGFAVNF